MKKILSLMFCSVAFLGICFAFAADSDLPSPSTETESMSLVAELEVGKVLFDPGTRIASVEVFITNPKDSFLDGFSYNLSLFQGDKYAEEGDIFNGMEYVLTKTGVFTPVAPGAKSKQTIEVDIPNSIQSGSYFIKLAANDRYSEVVGVTNASDAVLLTGDGSYMGFPEMFVLKDNNRYELLTGLLQSPEDSMVVGIDLTKSPKYKEYRDNGGHIIAYAEIVSLDGTLVYKYADPVSFTASEGGDILIANFKPWPAIASGPATLKLSLVSIDNKPLLLEPVHVRWLVDGFSAKITRFNSFSNTYTKGSSLDMDGVIGSVYTPANKRLDLRVEVTTDQDENITFSRTINLKGEEFAEFDLSDEKFPKDAVVASVVATLVDPDSQRVLDTYTINTNVGKFEAPVYSMWDINTVSILGGAAILLILTLLLITRIVRGKDKSIPPATYAAFFIAFSAIVASGFYTTDVSARNTTMKASTATVAFTSAPSGNIGSCPQTVSVKFVATASCPHCMNGNRIAAFTAGTYANGTKAKSSTFYGWFPGGMGNNFAGGPFAYQFPITLTNDNNSLSYYAAAMVERYINHGYCLASGWVSTPTRTASCTPNTNPNGGGGCGEGQYYCESSGSCKSNTDTSCNTAPGYEPFKINPDIPALIGPVKLRDALLGKPPIVNPGGTCVIDWSKEFISYNKLTVCRFTAPGVDVEFAPGDEDAPLSASILNVRNDTPYKLVCSESDSPIPPEESDGVCRLNWDYKEIN